MNKIEIRDLLSFRFPENARFSPNGTYLAWQAASCNEKENGYTREVYLYKDGRTMKMTSGGNSSLLAWDDDETMILIKQLKDDKSGKTHLYKLNVNGGEAQPWIDLPLHAEELLPCGDKYVLTAHIDANDPDAYLDTEETSKKKAEEKKRNCEQDYEVLDEVPYWFNGAGFTNKKRSAIFVMSPSENAETAPAIPDLSSSDKTGYALKRITSPLFDAGAAKLRGSELLFTGSEHESLMNFYSNLYSYDLDNNKKKVLYDKGDLLISDVIPLGEKLFIEASDMKEYGVNETGHIWELKRKNSLRDCGKPEVQLYNSVVGDCTLGGGHGRVIDGSTWYTLATVEDHTEIFSYDWEMKCARMLSFDGEIPFFDVHEGKIAICATDSTHLPEVYLGNLGELSAIGTGKTNVSRLNDKVLEGKYIALPERIDYESCGLSLHGWVLLPEGYREAIKEDPGKTFPAVLDVHGGPRCVYGTHYFHEMQVWVSRGYAVMFTNIKGSDGRGDEFADIRGEYGKTDFRNLMDFVDAVLAKYPEIDKNRLCETGGSYGGFMTNWIITHTDRFCAAASQRSIANWVSHSLISDIGPFFGPDQNIREGFFTDNAAKICSPEVIERLWDRSPLKYADNVSTPTLFIHSEQDYRCPMPEGMQMMQALAVHGVPTRLVLFHGENHELSRGGKPLHRIRRLTEISDWFDKYCNA